MHLTTKVRDWLVDVGGVRTTADAMQVYGITADKAREALQWCADCGLIHSVGRDEWQAHDRWERQVQVGGIDYKTAPKRTKVATPGRDKGVTDRVDLASMSAGAERIAQARRDEWAKDREVIIASVQRGESIRAAFVAVGRCSNLKLLPPEDAAAIRRAALDAIASGRRAAIGAYNRRKKTAEVER